MNASQDTSWQKILPEAQAICDKFHQMGYQVRKKVRVAVWSVGDNYFRYELHYLPRPVEEWTLLPNDGSPIRDSEALLRNADWLILLLQLPQLTSLRLATPLR